MTKTKLKEKSSAEIRSREKTRQISQTPEFISLIRDSWEEEISHLNSLRFSSLEELVEYFVTIVVARMGDVPDIEARKEFLREFFLHDEILSAELAALFSISNEKVDE